MAEQIASQQQADSTTSTTTTVTIDATDSPQQDIPTVCLTLRKPRCDRKVQWTTETVDNEDMDKKKSKCCCIYKKPRSFGESSSSESSDDEDPCHGHVEKKKKKKKTDCALHSEPHSDDMPASIESIPPTISSENLSSNNLEDEQQNPISAGPS